MVKISVNLVNLSFSLWFVSDSKRDHNRVNYDAPFTCYKCGKRYTWTDSLTRHLREGCGKLPRHKCTLCGRKFKRRDYLLRHENNVHKAEWNRHNSETLPRISKFVPFESDRNPFRMTMFLFGFYIVFFFFFFFKHSKCNKNNIECVSSSVLAYRDTVNTNRVSIYSFIRLISLLRNVSTHSLTLLNMKRCTFQWYLIWSFILISEFVIPEFTNHGIDHSTTLAKSQTL